MKNDDKGQKIDIYIAFNSWYNEQKKLSKGGNNMKFGMTSLTLKNESVEDVIRIVKEAGLEGIEWGVSDGHMPLCDAERAALIRKLSEENGIEIFSLGSYCYMETKEECDQALETAILLGHPSSVSGQVKMRPLTVTMPIDS